LLYPLVKVVLLRELETNSTLHMDYLKTKPNMNRENSHTYNLNSKYLKLAKLLVAKFKFLGI